MLEPNAPEIRHELAAARLAALHRSAGPVTPGPLRRAAGAALVRLGLRLGYDGRVPPSLAPEPTPGGPRPGEGLHPGLAHPVHDRERRRARAGSALRRPRGTPQNVITVRIPS
jgi:hypothetical protein